MEVEEKKALRYIIKLIFFIVLFITAITYAAYLKGIKEGWEARDYIAKGGDSTKVELPWVLDGKKMFLKYPKSVKVISK